jgi:hypothetical protein
LARVVAAIGSLGAGLDTTVDARRPRVGSLVVLLAKIVFFFAFRAHRLVVFLAQLLVFTTSPPVLLKLWLVERRQVCFRSAGIFLKNFEAGSHTGGLKMPTQKNI